MVTVSRVKPEEVEVASTAFLTTTTAKSAGSLASKLERRVTCLPALTHVDSSLLEIVTVKISTLSEIVAFLL